VGALAFLLVGVAAVAILVVPAELTFRAMNGQWYFQARAAQEEPAQADDFRLYRSRFPLQRPAGRVRILAVGGSTTYGLGVEAEQAWPRRLAARLEQSHPGRYEVVDVSYLGGHLEGFISDFHRVSRRYIPRDRWLDGARPRPSDLADWGWSRLEPDVVIVAPIVNDTAPDFLWMRKHADGMPQRLEAALERTPGVRDLAIAFYVRRVLPRLSPAAPPLDAAAAHARIRASYESSLERFVDLWGGSRHVLVVGLPWLFNREDGPQVLPLAMEVWGVADRRELADELSYLPPLERLEQEARQELPARRKGNALSVREVAASLKSRPFPQRLRYYLDPLHGTAEAHDLFAAEMHDLVVKLEPAAH
jgi:lysophospholipase L1-like esterase